MASRREHFAFQEHMVVGEILRRIDDDIRLVARAVEDAYGSAIYARIRKAKKILDEVKSLLDSKVCGEYPMSTKNIEGVPLTHVYYGDRADVPHRLKTTGYSDNFRNELRRLAGLSSCEPADRKAGRPRVIDQEKLNTARNILAAKTKSVEDVSRELGVAASTLYRYLNRSVA